MLGCTPERHIGKHFAGLLRTGMRLDDNARLSHALVRPIRTSAPCSRLNLGDSSQQVAVLALVTVRPNSGLDPRSRRNEFLHLLPNVHAPPQRLHLDHRLDGTERLASLAAPQRRLHSDRRLTLGHVGLACTGTTCRSLCSNHG